MKQTDVSLYLQDEWKIRPNFTLSPGFRYENQTNIDSNFNFAPRIAFAWSPVFGGAKKTAASKTSRATGANAAAAGTTPAATIAAAPPAPRGCATWSTEDGLRGGIGIFYNRISEDYTLQATRFNGTTSNSFSSPIRRCSICSRLCRQYDLSTSFRNHRFAASCVDDIHSFRSLRAMFTVERILPKNVKLSFSYWHSRYKPFATLVNINAPLGGTFIPGQPIRGVRPFGNEAGNIFEYQSTGRSMGNSFNIGT